MEDRTESFEPLREFIRQTIEEDYSAPRENQLIQCEFNWETCYASHEKPNMIRYFTKQERTRMISRICSDLFEAATDTDSHWLELERVFSGLLSCQWRPVSEVDVIVEQVRNTLQRLPRTPVPLPGDFSKLSPAWFKEGIKAWESLQVTTRIHKNLTRCAILGVITNTGKGTFDRDMQEGLNFVGEVMQQCLISSPARDESHQQTWLVVLSYLWSFWQRARILTAGQILMTYHRLGFNESNGKDQWMRNFQVAPNLSIRALTEETAYLHKPSSMCGWKFELLKGDSKCLGLDFRPLFERFQEAFGDITPKCLKDSTEACSGLDWHDCLRFAQSGTSNQTMHDDSNIHSYDLEPRIMWDKDSYKQVVGARAVSIDATRDRLTYCTASERTLAFSHVWSHGQGGRPHEGINRCLHQRYTRLARDLDCDSYWIDSACIPLEDELRKEAINHHINAVFYRSKYVLVCDRELMTLDADNLTTASYEKILVGVLLSDWNIRAWTMLEALKGREHVAILCRNDRVVRFYDVARQVCDNGELAIAAFLLLLPHMLPWRLEGTVKDDLSKLISPNDIPLETVGSWLSHRPASQKGDYVKIWSLCLNQERTRVKDAVEFWRQQRGVVSGFLLSSSDRLTEPGLSWAPASPFALPRVPHDGASKDIFHRPLPAADTHPHTITADGLWGTWWMCVRDNRPMFRIREVPTFSSKTNEELRKIRRSYRVKRNWLALLRPVSVVVPSRLDSVEDTPSVTKTGTLLAVCDSSQVLDEQGPFHERLERRKWIWRGVYEWPATVPMPKFTRIDEVWIG